MDSQVEERALVISVPEVEAFISSFRAAYEGFAGDYIPAHITINIPFKPDLNSDSDLDTILADLFSGIAPFQFALTEFRYFPEALYLVPEPEERFKELIMAVVARFPESPPYEGQFDDVIPHLTAVYLENPEELADMKAALIAAGEGVLPIRGIVSNILLLEKIGRKWRERTSFQLGS